MNTIEQDVICDLLPLYFAGEASGATRALVDAYFAAHPDFAALMRASQEVPAAVPPAAASHVAHAPIKRIRQVMRMRSILMGLAIAFTFMPFSFVFTDSQVVWFMLRDAPQASVVFGVAALVAWGMYFVTGRRIGMP